jgi:hypothetical protein
MRRFRVEVSQQSATLASRRIDAAVRTLGSHFATHADWRRSGGICTGSMVVEASDRCAALIIVPPAMRREARVFSLEAA